MLAKKDLKLMMSSNKAAVKCLDGELTYKELLHQSLNLADQILDLTHGKNAKICVISDRKLEFLLGIFAVMLSGSLYTIIDSQEDCERIVKKLETYNCDIVIDLSGILSELNFSDTPVISTFPSNRKSIEDIERLPSFEQSAGYIVYTSGSTGTPKAVHVTYANIEHYVDSISRFLNLEAGLGYAHVSSIEADLGNTSIYLSIKTMGTLHIIPHHTRTDPTEFAQYLIDEKVDVLKITPSHLSALMDALRESHRSSSVLKYLLSGGEVLRVDLVRKIFDNKITDRMFNHYGPTETTIGVLINEVKAWDLATQLPDSPLPIGKPFGQTRILVRTDQGYQTESCQGELLIGGPSVSKGYLNDLEQHRQKFIFIDDDLFYQSGDIVKMDKNGRVTFLFRKDRQVKVDGHRIELADLESQVKKCEGISAVYFNAIAVDDRNILACALESSSLDKDQAIALVKKCLDPKYAPKIVLVYQHFPLNSNGKVAFKAIDQRFSEEVTSTKESSNHLDLPKEHEYILTVWQKYVFNDTPSLDDNFYDLGGDSISAIQLVSELQRLNYNITASDFMSNPSLAGIIASIQKNSQSQQEIINEFELNYPIMQWFFHNIRNDRNHWTQSYLFNSARTLDPTQLRKALQIVCDAHPILSSKVFYDGYAYRAKISDQPRYFFTNTKYISTSESEIARAISYTSLILQESINLEEGKVFRLHHFQFADKEFLLFICHHLFIDFVSWKIILSEFIDVYDQLYLGNSVALPKERTPFGLWSKTIRENADLYLQHSVYWENRHPLNKQGKRPSRHNRESDGATLWIRLSSDLSKQLRTIEVNGGAVAYDHTILALVLASLGNIHDLSLADLFVESYGRDISSCTLDVSRSVGWFTTMFPIDSALDDGNIESILASLCQSLESIPNLGLPYGFLENSERHDPSQLNICYNFLGALDDFHGEYIDLANSSYQTAPCRGSTNERVFDIKITVKLVNHETFVAIEYEKQSNIANQTVRFASDLSSHAGQLLGITLNSDEIEYFTEEHHSIGKMNYIPFNFYQHHLSQGRKNYTKKHYDTVVLTGATGYIGINFLHHILTETEMKVVCLVRADSDQHARSRLAEVYSQYFGPQAILSEIYVTCCAADISQKNFSLSDAVYADLLENANAIYHFAADTRLFNKSENSYVSNVVSTDHVIDFCECGRDIDLHYASTLAISGVVKAKQYVVFSERSFDVGQSFQNSYEETKYESEKRVRNYHDRGGKVKIYRYGNVSANSVCSQFQSNSADNRFIQIVKGIVKNSGNLNRLPEDIVLTPVDFVAKSTLCISTIDTSNFVFHVDYQACVKFSKIIECLIEMGYNLERKDFNTNAYANTESETDHDIVLSDFWLSRENKNIRFNHSRTLSFLADHGIVEQTLSKSWLINLFKNLQHERVLPMTEYIEESA